MNLSEHIIFVLFLMQYSNIALLKMKYKVEADILTDDWPNFKCTVIKLPMSQVIHYVDIYC